MATVNAYGGTEGSGSRGQYRGSGPHTNTNGHVVGFRVPSNDPQYSQEREKYLTAKYPRKTMHLIRKRIAVEYYMDEELRRLYGVVCMACKL